MAKRAKPKVLFHRCTRCHSLIPVGYTICGTCGFNAPAAATMFDRAMKMFPGSTEVYGSSSKTALD